jgi:hypothetical protein
MARIVLLITQRRTEDAVQAISSIYGLKPPKLKIGLPRGKSRVLACYVTPKHTIFFSDEDSFFNPFVVLHEFYHALRAKGGKHRGSEKKANKFAEEYIQAYLRWVDSGEL